MLGQEIAEAVDVLESTLHRQLRPLMSDETASTVVNVAVNDPAQMQEGHSNNNATLHHQNISATEVNPAEFVQTDPTIQFCNSIFTPLQNIIL